MERNNCNDLLGTRFRGGDNKNRGHKHIKRLRDHPGGPRRAIEFSRVFCPQRTFFCHPRGGGDPWNAIIAMTCLAPASAGVTIRIGATSTSNDFAITLEGRANSPRRQPAPTAAKHLAGAAGILQRHGGRRRTDPLPTSASMIQAVIFDLGRVLVDVDEDAGWYGLLRRERPEVVREFLDGADRHEVFRRFGLGAVAAPEVHRKLDELTGLSLEYDRFVALWCAVLKPKPAMEAVFLRVAEQCRVGLLSNTNPLHWREARVRFPWLRQVTCPTLSYEVGRLKPDPEIYRIAAADVGEPAERCLFVDDLEANVAGALAVGMQAFRFVDPEDCVARLRSLHVLTD